MCLWAIKHHGPGVHVTCFVVDVAHSVVETQIWLGWPDGLEKNCLWAVFPLSSLDGLERRSRHDKWALNELNSFC